MSVTDADVKRVAFHGWPCIIRFDRYINNNRTAIQLVHADEGDLVATATINIPEARLADDQVIIKDYGENSGMLETLVNAGIVEDTGFRILLPFVEVPVCRLLVKEEGLQ